MAFNHCWRVSSSLHSCSVIEFNQFWWSDPNVCYLWFTLYGLSLLPITTGRADYKQTPTAQDTSTYLPAPHSRCQCCRAPLQRCWPARTCPRCAPRSAPHGSSCCQTRRRWRSRMTLRTSSFCNIHQDWWCIVSVGCTRWSLSGPADSFHQQGCSIAAAAGAGCCCGCDAWWHCWESFLTPSEK